MPGPLPEPNSRRRNAPTIPTTKLPVSGRKGRPPKVPEAYNLNKAGITFWKWAWSQPQAAGWDSGSLYVIARRAELEDLHAALEECEYLDFAALFADPAEAEEKLRWLIGSLKALAAGTLNVMKEMRELDGKLGLSPKALADLRWTIVDDDAGAAKKKRPAPAPKSNVRQLRPSVPGSKTG